jgi:hypothetical protein
VISKELVTPEDNSQLDEFLADDYEVLIDGSRYFYLLLHGVVYFRKKKQLFFSPRLSPPISLSFFFLHSIIVS